MINLIAILKTIALLGTIATGLLGVLQNYWSVRISQGLVFDLRNQLYRHLQRLSLAFFRRFVQRKNRVESAASG